MKYFIIAGEASGDLHGSRLVARLKELDKKAILKAWGGDLMASAGAEIIKHYRELAFMGFVEVLLNIRTILQNISLCKKQIQSFKPDAIVFIDYPGFNLRMVQWAKANGYRTFYYISPQLWAWKEGRVKHIKSSVDKLFTILPFENEFYKKHEVYPEFVGHPLLEIIKDFAPDEEVNQLLKNKKIVALLPGSRKQEISKMLPVFLRTAELFPEYTPVIAAAPSLPLEYYNEIIQTLNTKSDPIVIQSKTYTVLNQASLAWVSSGTATLETALFGVPQIVCYAGNKISYFIAKRLVKIKYISLVNLILDRPLIKELIQDEFTVANLAKETKLLNPQQIREEYRHLHDLLLPENTSYRVAQSIIESIKQS